MVEVKEETLDEQITSPTVQHNAIHNRKDFNSLPHLAKSTIVEHLPRITDLKNICLVSKELHEIAVRFLYKSVSLDVGCASDHRLPAFLNPRNKGLKHIRQIRLYLAVVADRCNQELLASLATRMILELLPEDILDEFRSVSRTRSARCLTYTVGVLGSLSVRITSSYYTRSRKR